MLESHLCKLYPSFSLTAVVIFLALFCFSFPYLLVISEQFRFLLIHILAQNLCKLHKHSTLLLLQLYFPHGSCTLILSWSDYFRAIGTRIWVVARIHGDEMPTGVLATGRSTMATHLQVCPCCPRKRNFRPFKKHETFRFLNYIYSKIASLSSDAWNSAVLWSFQELLHSSVKFLLTNSQFLQFKTVKYHYFYAFHCLRIQIYVMQDFNSSTWYILNKLFLRNVAIYAKNHCLNSTGICQRHVCLSLNRVFTVVRIKGIYSVGNSRWIIVAPVGVRCVTQTCSKLI